MGDINRVVLVGRLTREPEKRTTAGDNKVPYVICGIACSRYIPGRNGGEGFEETSFLDLEVWNNKTSNLAEIFGDHARKGQPIHIEGRMAYQRWETEDKQVRKRTYVHVRDFTFLDTKENSSGVLVDRNEVTLFGRLTREPEMRYTSKGKPFVTIAVATSRGKNPAGEPVSDFHNLTSWFGVEKYVKELRKGSLVYIMAHLHSYNIDNDSKRKITELVIDRLGGFDRTNIASNETKQEVSSPIVDEVAAPVSSNFNEDESPI